MIKNNTKNGRCTNCGECCSEYIPWTQEEVNKVKAYLFDHPEIKQDKHIIGKDQHMLCTFRDMKNKTCRIYPVRPQVCRSFICNMMPDAMHNNKIIYHKKADYNSMDDDLNLKRFASSHLLFFKDYNFDIQYMYNMCSTEEQVMRMLKGMDAVVMDHVKAMDK